MQSESIPVFLKPVLGETLNHVQLNGQLIVSDTEKSILGTSKSLWNDQNYLVAILIITFSVVIPAIKLLIIGSAQLSQNRQQQLHHLSGALSKWSMADVFVMAILISFLAIKATDGNSNLVTNQVTLEAGFYFFIGYCVLSIIASQLFQRGLKQNAFAP